MDQNFCDKPAENRNRLDATTHDADPLFNGLFAKLNLSEMEQKLGNTLPPLFKTLPELLLVDTGKVIDCVPPPRANLPVEKNDVRLESSKIKPDDWVLPIGANSIGKKSDEVFEALKPANWVLPIGGDSSDKKKGVPLQAVDKPDPSLPDVWNHPESSAMDGKCGITGVANMLRFYGVEKSPADIDVSRYRSWGVGLRSEKFASDLTELSGKKFSAHSIDDGSSGLDMLRQQIKDGKPVAIQYMTSPTNAHWVVVAGVTDGKDGPELTVQSWGGYHKVPYKDIQDNWRRGYGGPYPYVVGDEQSSLLKPKK